MVSNLITEDHFKDLCMYCGTNLDNFEWKSEFIGTIHYKTTECKCKTKITIHVPFMGSGHDHWEGKKNPFNKKIKTQKNKSTIKTLDTVVANMVKK
jgi:hypothetical protein